MSTLEAAKTVIRNLSVQVGGADSQRYREGRFECRAAWSLVTTADGDDATGATASGYIMESGAGGDGLDWHYSHLTSCILADLWIANRDPRILRWISMVHNTLAPRFVRTGGELRYDIAGGTRQATSATEPVLQRVTSPMLAVLEVNGRAALSADAALGSATVVADTLSRSTTGGDPFGYRSTSRDLAALLDLAEVGRAT